jgi:hypothetical protein
LLFFYTCKRGYDEVLPVEKVCWQVSQDSGILIEKTLATRPDRQIWQKVSFLIHLNGKYTQSLFHRKVFLNWDDNILTLKVVVR